MRVKVPPWISLWSCLTLGARRSPRTSPWSCLIPTDARKLPWISLIPLGASLCLAAGFVTEPAAVFADTGAQGSTAVPTLADANTKAVYEAAEEAFQRAAELKRSGDLVGAAAMFRQVLRSVDSETDLAASAEAELHLHLPVLEAQRRLVSGDSEQAQQVLRQAIELNRDDPERVRLLTEMLRNVSLLRGVGANANDVDGQVILSRVQGILVKYRTRTGSYPRNYLELNQLLPADLAPLNHYDIIYYVGSRNEFVVSLRSKKDRSNTLTLHKTSLVQ